ncbi:dihydrolipoyl dehydrogenase family protein [Allorhodopirellula solitaria]|uniref:Glutathione amide reductase n=1 Tax=Allorhodopirellula solitaria TaxID=2527987 RepID=A0A5C5YG43_9BACT|nr:NAD(P)/FAD-dependent oxidoreductase [Allorhodopirellula solitaria]TWT74078.1 Glutathione amide reductase [Allorhodopirellula solitaria]
MSDSVFDLIVIGTGPSASTIAHKCRSGGKRVAVVEERGFGGVCALRGCNPKKVYTNAADLVDRVRGAAGRLVDDNGVTIDWEQLLAFKREFTQPVLEKSEASYRDKGIATFHGSASFAGPRSIAVDGQILEAERIFVGVGAHPRPLEIPGGKRAILSDEFFELSRLPRRVVFIGGGYISMEFACVAARSGAEVTVLQRPSQVLPPFDPDLVDQLVEYSRERGVKVVTGANVTAIDGVGGQEMNVMYETTGAVHSAAAELVVHGAGRIPNLDDLGLDAGEVAFGEHGIQVDPFMRSVSNPAVFAAGDCADSGKPPLTPTANEEARIIVKNLFVDEPTQRPDYGVIPQVAFTVPAIAAIGMSQAEAEAAHDVDVRSDDTSTWGSVRKTGQRCAGYKVLIDKQSDRILGAHLLGPAAEETINLFALAMKHNLTATDMKSTLFTFPTFASDVRRMV